MGNGWLVLWNAGAGLWAAGMLRALGQGTVFILALGAICRLFPRLPATARGWLWWLACVKLMLGLAWAMPLSLAVLPAARQRAAPQALAQTVIPAVQRLPESNGLGPTSSTPALTLSRPAPATPPVSVLSWAGLLMGLWSGGLAWRLRGMLRQWRTVQRMVAGARPVTEARIRQEAEQLAATLRLRRLPLLLESPDAPGPLVVGRFHPAVLLPEGSAALLTPEELRMALAHELAHVQRKDLWWSLPPYLTQWLFFFYPLAALAWREWATAREADCDAAALRATGVPAADYGRLLLKLAARNSGSALPALGATAGFEALKRRLTMLPPISLSRRARWGLIALMAAIAVAALPWHLTARAAPAAARAQVAAEREAEMATCAHHLADIGRALAAYRRDHGELPAHLTDLFPKYVSDLQVFHCPADKTSGSPRLADDYADEIAPPSDPRPVSYAYYMSPVKPRVRFGGLGPPRPRGADDSWRGQMLAMRDQYGDRVPVVRCWHHAKSTYEAYTRPLVLSLTLDGSVYRSTGNWQGDPQSLAGVVARMEGDLTQGPERFLRRWNLGAIAELFGFAKPVPTLQARLCALAVKLGSLGREPLKPDRETHLAADLPAAIGSLYAAAGDRDRAIARYQAVIDHMDPRVPYFQLGEIAAARCLPALYDLRGQHAKAIAVYRQIIRKNPGKWDWYIEVAREYDAMGQTKTALALRRKWDPAGLLRDKPAPEFRMADAAGQWVDMAKLRGQVVVLFFWCSAYPRQNEAARQLAALERRYGRQGLMVICLARRVAAHAAAVGVGPNPPYPLLLHADAIFQRYGVREGSMLDIVDRQGNLAQEYSGYGMDPGEERWLEHTVPKLLGGVLAARPGEPRH